MAVTVNYPRDLAAARAEGTPQVVQNLAQAIDVQIAEAQGDWQQRCVAYQAGIKVEPTAVPVMATAATEVESGRLMQVDLATPRDGQTGQRESAETPDPTAADAGASDVPAGDAHNEAPTAGSEKEDVHNTQEAAAASHALSPPVDQETRFRVPPG